MGYLIQNDYRLLIQKDNLTQIIGSDLSIITSLELSAVTEVTDYLVQKYDVKAEFTDTVKFDFAVAYNAKNRVYIDATVYNPLVTYALNSLMLSGGNVYYCNTAITVPEALDLHHWTLLGAQYQMFYAADKYADWKYTTLYNAGDHVQDGNYTYTCLQTNQGKKPSDNPSQWGVGTLYSFTNQMPTNTTYWVSGDNRNQKMIGLITDVMLYQLHKRISPNNVPEIRRDAYQYALDLLRRYAKGTDVTAALPLLQPNQGMRNRSGNRLPKQNNNI